jgi:hypothetical protein
MGAENNPSPHQPSRHCSQHTTTTSGKRYFQARLHAAWHSPQRLHEPIGPASQRVSAVNPRPQPSASFFRINCPYIYDVTGTCRQHPSTNVDPSYVPVFTRPLNLPYHSHNSIMWEISIGLPFVLLLKHSPAPANTNHHNI